MNLETTRFVIDLPYTVVGEHIRRNGVAILASGSLECHGPHLPEGTDTFIVEAIAHEVARRCDGLVFPTFVYTYSGGTAAFPGTVTLPGQVQRDHTRAVMLKLIRDGYRHIMHLQWHAPYYVNEQLTREIFEETGVPVLFVGILNMPLLRDPEMLKLIGPDGPCWEANLVAGALKLLGKPPLPVGRFTADTQSQPRPEDPHLRAIGAQAGIVGHFFTDPSQHLPVRCNISADNGAQAIAMFADAISKLSEPLGKYVEVTEDRRKG
jgi:hypothetical protein